MRCDALVDARLGGGADDHRARSGRSTGWTSRSTTLCLRLLALHQPTARDLRLITTALKITTDLERAGDMAENICERAIELNQEPQLKPFIDMPRMADDRAGDAARSLDAFVREDVDLALRGCRDDDRGRRPAPTRSSAS